MDNGYPKLKQRLADRGINVSDKHFYCRGQFMMFNKDLPSVDDVGTYRFEINEFAKNLEASYAEIDGDGSLLFNFLNGDWDEDYFTIIDPNCEIMATNDNNIIGCKF